jgi:o-succinylbenzoate synthase
MHLLEHRIYRRAFQAPVRTAHGSWTQREGILLRLRSQDGTVGFGEVAPIPDFGTETLAS